jgi:tetratricopeptide (TPR) repeat protein
MNTPPKQKWASRVRAAKERIRSLRRPIYVISLSLLAAGFFAFTFNVNRLYAEKRRNLSAYWFQQGQEELEEGRPENAIPRLRTALLYSHENSRYVFNLARALAAANRVPEARSYLLNLLDEEPGSGQVNLELGRLAAKDNDANHARRYFNAAIYGAWEGDPLVKRQQARQELINFLIADDLKTQAHGELMSYTAEMPSTTNAQLWVARTSTKLGDDRSALDFYVAASQTNRRDVTALLGAGWAAFRLSRYREALEYFKGAFSLHEDPSTSQMIEIVSSVIDLNPFDSSISAAERRHRLMLAMKIADERLKACGESHDVDLDTVSGDPLQLARSQWNYLNRQLRGTYSNSALVQLLPPVASLISNIEQKTGCGAQTPSNQAMLRIYQAGGELQR